jgi:hypothetical protein
MGLVGSSIVMSTPIYAETGERHGFGYDMPGQED